MNRRHRPAACGILAASLLAGPWFQVDAQAPAAGGTNAPRKAAFVFPFKKGDRLVARFSSVEAPRPLSTTLVELKGFKVETFNADGTPNLVGDAPVCLLNITSRDASSSGPLTLTQVGGAFSLRGEGFHWNQDDESLRLSNKVHAVFQLRASAAGALLSPPK
ncbi:MAG: hypothetical protein J0L84_13985 [Verrucomicrobia bacterium]|nr:hypothetical protein [Verrucomicrobiota bacterium]